MSKSGVKVETKLSTEEFVKRAITTYRTEKSKGIHSTFPLPCGVSFNQLFKAYYGGADPVLATKALAEAKKIEVVPAKGGVRLYLKGEIPKSQPKPVDPERIKAALAAIMN
jgi:hypothetical protein